MKDYVIAIDVGSGFVKAAIGRKRPSGVEMISVVEERAAGIERGLITDGPQAAETIRRVIHRLYESSSLDKFEYLNVVAGISGKSIFSSSNVEGMISLRDNRPIDEKDVKKVIEQAKTMANIPNDHEIVYVHPHVFIVDKPETGTVRNPIGMYGKSLKVKAYIISVDAGVLRNFRSVFQAAEVGDVDFYFSPIVESYGVLDEEDRSEGAILMDIGRDLFYISIWNRGSIYYTLVEEKGLSQLLLRDLMAKFSLTRELAEDLLMKSRILVEEDYYTMEETIELLDRRRGFVHRIPLKTVSAIISGNMEKFFATVKSNMDQIDVYSKLDRPQIYITGGGALIENIDVVAENVFSMGVTVGLPNVYTLDEAHNNPRYGVLSGLIRYYFESPGTTSIEGTRSGGGLLRGLIEKLKELF